MMATNTFIQRRLHVVALLVIIVLGLLVNYVHSDFIAHGSDEFAYMRIARQTVFFDNKEPSLYPPNTNPHLVSYTLGIVSQMSGLEIFTIFRIVHVFVIILTILSFYSLLSRFSKVAGLIGALLAALYPTASSGLGLATLVPSTLVLFALPHVFIHFLDKRYLALGAWLLFVLLFYWWALIPFILCFMVYFLLKRQHYFLISILAMIFVAASHIIFLRLLHFDGVFEPFPFTDFLNISDTPFWKDASLSFIIKRASTYIPLVLLLVCLPFVYKKIKDKTLIHVALSLLIVNLTLLFVSQAAQSRTIYFLYSGLFLLASIIFSKFNFGKYYRGIVISIFIVMVASGTVRQVFGEFLDHPQTNRNEIKLFRWIARNTSSDAVLISDYHTMETSQFFINNQTTQFFNEGNAEVNTQDFGEITKILDADTFSESDLEYLHSLRERVGGGSLYVIITGRTRSLMEYYENTGEYIHTRVLNKDYYRSGVFEGEAKFSKSPFILVYSDTDEASQKPFSVFQLDK